mmetsp:Transcript_2997/g.5003  ORF Transcript_2997/g.5003 Transcript_2997/m.5003 type:complete len:213 (-) Transcript_2997:1515-2153(-)
MVMWWIRHCVQCWRLSLVIDLHFVRLFLFAFAARLEELVAGKVETRRFVGCREGIDRLDAARRFHGGLWFHGICRFRRRHYVEFARDHVIRNVVALKPFVFQHLQQLLDLVGIAAFHVDVNMHEEVQLQQQRVDIVVRDLQTHVVCDHFEGLLQVGQQFHVARDVAIQRDHVQVLAHQLGNEAVSVQSVAGKLRKRAIGHRQVAFIGFALWI